MMTEFGFLASATLTTLQLAFVSVIVGLVLAIIFMAWETLRFKPLAWLGSTLALVIRGLPELLVVFFFYHGSAALLLLLDEGFSIGFGHFSLPIQISFADNAGLSPFMCGVIALSMLYSAYASQTLRGALQAIPVGQKEAGLALGMHPLRIFFSITLPQMWRHALPGLGNQWLVLLKDTALVSLISVNDLMMQTNNIVRNTHQPFTWYLLAAVIYLIITLLSQFLLRRIELRVTRHELTAS